MRISLFIILVVVAVTFPWWVGTIGALLYALRYTAYEVILLGALFDAQFATLSSAPLYIGTISAVVLFVSVEILKPFLSFYEEAS